MAEPIVIAIQRAAIDGDGAGFTRLGAAVAREARTTAAPTGAAIPAADAKLADGGAGRLGARTSITNIRAAISVAIAALPFTEAAHIFEADARAAFRVAMATLSVT